MQLDHQHLCHNTSQPVAPEQLQFGDPCVETELHKTHGDSIVQWLWCPIFPTTYAQIWIKVYLYC